MLIIQIIKAIIVLRHILFFNINVNEFLSKVLKLCNYTELLIKYLCRNDIERTILTGFTPTGSNKERRLQGCSIDQSINILFIWAKNQLFFKIQIKHDNCRQVL